MKISLCFKKICVQPDNAVQSRLNSIIKHFRQIGLTFQCKGSLCFEFLVGNEVFCSIERSDDLHASFFIVLETAVHFLTCNKSLRTGLLLSNLIGSVIYSMVSLEFLISLRVFF